MSQREWSILIGINVAAQTGVRLMSIHGASRLAITIAVLLPRITAGVGPECRLFTSRFQMNGAEKEGTCSFSREQISLRCIDPKGNIQTEYWPTFAAFVSEARLLGITLASKTVSERPNGCINTMAREFDRAGRLKRTVTTSSGKCAATPRSIREYREWDTAGRPVRGEQISDAKGPCSKKTVVHSYDERAHRVIAQILSSGQCSDRPQSVGTTYDEDKFLTSLSLGIGTSEPPQEPFIRQQSRAKSRACSDGTVTPAK